ncbi:hypothetical protein D3C76_336160 [compost metagenome]
MTEVRDWQKDMELAHHARYEFVSMQPRHLNTLIDVLFHWLQQYAAEKERADKAEAEAEKWRIESFRKYPTPEAYDTACTALHKHRERADKAEEREKKLREEMEKAMYWINMEAFRIAYDVLQESLLSLYPDKEEEAK